MLNKVCSLFVILSLSTGLFADAAKGKIFGIVKDKESMQPVKKAQVFIIETQTILETDDYGNFNIDLDPGKYNIIITHQKFYTTYATMAVEPGKMDLIEVFMPKNGKGSTDKKDMDAVTINVKALKNTEHSVLEAQKKSLNVSDGISSQTFRKNGDGYAGQAIKRIPGLSVEGGKYVYVRGLGDRYSKTQLNGLDLPGIDPDRNTVQMDIFPTNLIDNIFVTKTFSADKPGDYTGGLVDIITKDFPVAKTTSYAFSLAYNPAMNLRSDFLSYKSSAMDVFAAGSKSRAIPVDPNVKTPIAIPGDKQLEDMTRAFNPVMAAALSNSFIDHNISYSLGNQIRSKSNKNRTYGYNVALNNSMNYRHYGEVIYNQYAKDRDKSINELQEVTSQKGTQSEVETAWSGLANFSTKTKYNKYTFTAFHSRNVLKQAAQLRSEATSISSTPGAILGKNVLYYNQRDVTTLSLAASHNLKNGKAKVEWALAPSLSNNKEPDMRQAFFAYEDNGDITLNIGDGARVTRLWRNLQEKGANAKVDYIIEGLTKKGFTSNWKAGLFSTVKNRVFEINRYEFRDMVSRKDYTGNPNELFEASNIYSAENNDPRGLVVQGEPSLSNNYNATSTIFAGYVQNELHLSSKLKTIYGLRLEKADMYYTGQNQAGLVYDNENLLNTFTPLPSLAVIYSSNVNTNLRFNASRTVARPSFKEKSLAQIYDAVTGRTFIGNLDLEQTNITNVDVRWENFGDRGQMFSGSVFAKNFENPIEIVAYAPETPDNFQARNVASGQMLGAEIEFRKNINFLSSLNSLFTINTNLSYIHSSVRMNDEEYRSRVQEQRTGETLKRTRQMQGQSPYLINAGVNYTTKSGWQANLSYNVQGPRLSIVGIGVNADVYERQFHSLNMNVQKTLDKAKKWSVALMADNILQQKRIMYQKSYESENKIYTQMSPFTSVKCTLRYSI